MIKEFPMQGQVTSYLVPVPVPAGTGMGSYRIGKIEGYFNQGVNTTAFLQIHDATGTAGLTSGVSIPIRSLLLQGANGFLWQYSNEYLALPPLANGLFFVLSNTDNVYTTYSGGSNVDLQIGIEDWQIDTLSNSLTTAGDTTTLLKSRNIWSDNGTFAHNLKTLFVTMAISGTTTNYIQLFAKNPGGGAVVVEEWPIALGLLQDYSQNPSVSIGNSIPACVTSNGTTLTLSLNFGPNGGYVPFSTDTNGTQHYGCFIRASTTSGTLTLPAGNDVTIQATYV